MADYILTQSKKFQKLVVQQLSKKKSIIRYIPNVTNISNNLAYIYRNALIIHKNNLNQLYKNNFSDDLLIIFILYKNINYKNNFTYLSFNEKQQIKGVLNKITYKFDVNNIFVLGRKYTDKLTGITNCNSLSTLCNIYGLHNKQKQRIKKIEGNEDFSKNYRRILRDNLINSFHSKLSMNQFYNNSIFLDTEYVTDIIDDFSEFPLSKNLSMNFMIGLAQLKKDNLEYTNLIIDDLSHCSEYILLTKFISYLELFAYNKSYILLVHWSKADKISLTKSLHKYPDLQSKFNTLNCIFLDLMDVCKKSIQSNSFSLKYIAKNIMSFNYDSDCQNGFDAMLTYISSIEKNDNSNLHDIIKYNKIDTELLYKLIKYIVG